VPVYANAADCTDYIDGLVIDDPASFDRLIARAERDVDGLLGAYPRDATTGLKWDPTRLYAWQADALARAVAAQVEYLLALDVVGAGASAIIGRQATAVKGPDFEVTYADGGSTVARYGPKVGAELGPLRELIVRNARARA